MNEIQVYLTHCRIEDHNGRIAAILLDNQITDATFFNSKFATYELLKDMGILPGSAAKLLDGHKGWKSVAQRLLPPTH